MRLPPIFSAHPMSFEKAREFGCVRAVCHHVVDGDTADFFLDLGWYQYSYVSLRLSGINTPELRGTSGAELEKAIKARDRFEQLALNHCALVRSHKHKKSFNRFIADVFVSPCACPTKLEDWSSVGDILLEEGLASPW